MTRRGKSFEVIGEKGGETVMIGALLTPARGTSEAIHSPASRRTWRVARRIPPRRNAQAIAPGVRLFEPPTRVRWRPNESATRDAAENSSTEPTSPQPRLGFAATTPECQANQPCQGSGKGNLPSPGSASRLKATRGAGI